MDDAIEHFELAITTFIRGGCEAYSKDISSTYYLMGLAGIIILYQQLTTSFTVSLPTKQIMIKLLLLCHV